MLYNLYKPIQQMSSTLHTRIWISRELTKCIKYLIEVYNEISSHDLKQEDSSAWYRRYSENNNWETGQHAVQIEKRTFAMLYNASQA